jgi:hypothetical protein
MTVEPGCRGGARGIGGLAIAEVVWGRIAGQVRAVERRNGEREIDATSSTGGKPAVAIRCHRLQRKRYTGFNGCSPCPA